MGQLDKVIRPSEVAFFSDGGLDRPYQTDANGQPEVTHNLLITKDCNGPLLEYVEKKLGRLPYDRHRGGSLNITYADGHGGFVQRVTKTPANPAIEPDHAYTPKTRVSPFNSGYFPVP